MFEYLKKYPRILVTGPQRSGTTICARMIAHDAGYRYVDENEVSIHSFDRVIECVNESENVVVHCPGVMRFVHHVGDREDVAVVVMHRPINDIQKSQERIQWGGEFMERAKYGNKPGIISEIKYEFFEDYQRNLIKNIFDICYESLKTHPFWVPKDMRRNFAARQTQIGRVAL